MSTVSSDGIHTCVNELTSRISASVATTRPILRRSDRGIPESSLYVTLNTFNGRSYSETFVDVITSRKFAIR